MQIFSAELVLAFKSNGVLNLAFLVTKIGQRYSNIMFHTNFRGFLNFFTECPSKYWNSNVRINGFSISNLVDFPFDQFKNYPIANEIGNTNNQDQLFKKLILNTIVLYCALCNAITSVLLFKDNRKDFAQCSYRNHVCHHFILFITYDICFE